MATKSLKSVYDQFTSQGVNIGSYDKFSTAMQDPARRKTLYNIGTSHGVKLGSYNDFSSVVTTPQTAPPRKTAPTTGATPQTIGWKSVVSPILKGVPSLPASVPQAASVPMPMRTVPSKQTAPQKSTAPQKTSQKDFDITMFNPNKQIEGIINAISVPLIPETEMYQRYLQANPSAVQRMPSLAPDEDYERFKKEENERIKQEWTQQKMLKDGAASLEKIHAKEGNEAARKAWLNAGVELEKLTAPEKEEKHWYDFLRDEDDVNTKRRMERNAYNVARMTTHDLEKLMEDTWNNLSVPMRKAMIDNYKTLLQKAYPGADGKWVYNEALRMAHQESNKRLYEYAVKMNAPKSTLDFILKSATQSNVLYKLNEGATVVQAGGKTGDMAAREAAMDRYAQNASIATNVTATVLGMSADPTTYLGGWVGGAATKLLTKGAGRYLTSNLLGRVVLGSAGSSANMGVYEGIGELATQLQHGGKVEINEDGTYSIGGYSFKDIAKRFGHGAMMGASIGWISPVSGNVSDMLVSNTEGTIKKMMTRSGVFVGATTLEGTIFSMPEWLEGKENSFDVWTNNMAMMVGFKGTHVVKTARNYLGDISKSFESPKSGTKNKQDFLSRWRMRVDAPSDGGMTLTNAEKAELKKFGYDFWDLYKKGKTKSKQGATLGAPSDAPLIVSTLTDLVYDQRVSEAARAKMYYFATGRRLPVSTIMRGELSDNGNGTFTVNSVGVNGVITSRTYGNRKSAELELGRINRQAELNQAEIGERFRNMGDFRRHLYDACAKVGEANGWDPQKVYDAVVEARRKSSQDHNYKLSEAESAIFGKVLAEFEEYNPSETVDRLASSINKKYGFDVYDVIRKDFDRRTDIEQRAVDEYIKSLFPKEEQSSVFADATDVTGQKTIAENGVQAEPNETPIKLDTESPTETPKVREYNLGDEVDAEYQGTPVRAVIQQGADADGKMVVRFEGEDGTALGVGYLTKEELDAMAVRKETAESGTPNPTGGTSGTTDPNLAETGGNNTPTPLERVPRNEKNEPVFEQAESPEVGWDALVEFSGGDSATAKEIADAMTEEKRKALDKTQKQKLNGTTPAEMLVSKKANAEELAKAEAEYNMWQRIAGVEQSRKEAERARLEEEARQRAEAEKKAREEKERREREALDGVPEWHMDTPENARKRGTRRYEGQLFTRQEPVNGVVGKEVEVKFSQKDLPKGNVAVIEAEQLQPSHIQGRRNPMFFIDEAQPKDRTDAVSRSAARDMAEGIRPQEITEGTTAYTGAPTVNARGEVIQGNNRSDALRYLWEYNLPEQQKAYKQYLIDNAERLGLDPNAIEAMKHPVLVNRIDVSDGEAIRLGQMTAQDTESGGIERIKPKNVAQKLGGDMRVFANKLLESSDGEATFGQLVDRNGEDVLKWMHQKGVISDTQYKSAFDSKGNLTAEARNDLQKVLYQAVFKGGSQQLEEAFDRLPAKAQRALLSTAFRDMDSPLAGKMLPEIQASVMAYDLMMQDEAFVKAKKMEEVLKAIEDFKRQTALDDRFEQYVPADNFSNFALHLAGLYKASDMSQTTIASYFNKMYDLAQGKKAATLFEEADTTEYPLAEVIKQVLGIDYKPAKNGYRNDTDGGTDVALRNRDGQGGELRGSEPPAGGEQDKKGTEPTQRGGGTESTGSTGGGKGDLPTADGRGKGEENELDEKGIPFIKADNGTTVFGEITEDSGLTAAPIKLSEGFQDANTGKGYGLVHIEANHGEQIRQAGFSSVEDFVSFVATHYDPDNIRVGKRRDDGRITFLIQVTDGHDNTLFIELSKDGSYWNVNSGGIFRKGYSSKKETVAKTEPKQPNNANSGDPLLSVDVKDGITNTKPNGESTASDGKGTALPSKQKTSDGEKTAEELAKQKEREEKKRQRAELARKRAEQRAAEKRKAEEKKNAPNIDRKATDRLGEVSDKGVDESELPKEMAFRVTDVNEVDDILKTGGMRQMPDGGKVEGAEIETVKSKNGGSFKIGRDEGRDHGGKAFAKNKVWGATAGGSVQQVVIGVPGEKTQWRKGFHASYTKPKPWGEIEDGKPLLLEFGEDGRVAGLTAADMRFWVRGRDGKYYELTPKKEAPKAEEQQKTVADLEKEYNDANDNLGDLEEEWRDRILDYVDEHYPTQATLSAETTSERGLKEREAMKKDPVLAKMRADAKKAVDEADGKVREVFDRLEKAKAELAEANRTDKQGNPVDDNGKLVTEKAERIEDLTDEDFTAPTRSVTLPTLPKLVDDAIGAEGKPVVIKKNIFEKNKKAHKDLTPEQSREILNNALYRPDLYGQNKKTTRPYNWILIHNAEKHSSVVLEVSHGKDNVEIVNWHYLDDAALKQKERQAVKEGGLILTLKSAAGDAHDGLSESKGSEDSKKAQEKGGESSEKSGNIDRSVRSSKVIDEERLAIERKAKSEGTWLKAPNGKRTNLDETQWVNVRTKNFKDWFGDWENDPENASKIVDENGEPMVVYHDTNSTTLVNRKTGQNFNDLSKEERFYWQMDASNREFEETWEERPFYTFDNQHYGRRGIEMPAFFFTPNYDEYHEYGDRTIAVFLNIRKPIENPEIPNAGVTDTAGEDAMKRYIEMGYDGFIREYDGVVEETNAFFSNQIKSAVENDGSYSPKNNDIRRSAGSTGMSSEADKATEVTSREAALRDALVERMREAGLDVSMDVEEGQRVLDEENGKTRLMSFGEPYDYETYPLGRVEPDLSEKSVELVDVGIDHGFSNYKEARTWAKQNIAKTYNSEETGGKGNVRISNAAIDKFLSQSAVDKSDSKDVHMAVLKTLPDVLRTSIDVETHPDFLKGEDGKRNVENGINKDVLVHRCYGAVSVDGKLYRVKITLKELPKESAFPHVAHSYEATKIELLAGHHGENPKEEPSPRYSNNSISAAKLLKNVEMSYNPSEKILEASKKRSKAVREQRVFHGSGADFDRFDHSHMGEGEGAQAYGWGTYVTEVEGIGRMYAESSTPFSSPFINGAYNAMRRDVSNGRSFEDAKAQAVSHITKLFRNSGEDWEGATETKEELEMLKGMTESDFNNRHLYTVEIPDDTGENYLDWDGKLTGHQKKVISKAIKKLKIDMSDWERRGFSLDGTGEDVYDLLVRALRHTTKWEDINAQRSASKFLSSIGFVGISFPAEYQSGGRKDGKKNYVIFNEGDARITDHTRFFRTSDGEAYGFTVGGKIYIDPRIATSETPIHEYSHLWTDMLRRTDPKQWAHLVKELKGSHLWEEVKRSYPHLETDDEIADETFATLSGRRGAERLREEMDEILKGDGSVTEKSAALSALERVKKAISDFWRAVLKMFGINRYYRADELADMALKDLLEGKNPLKDETTMKRGERKVSPAEMSENEMAERVEALSAKLNIPVRIVRTGEEVAAMPTERQRRQKGSYNTRTGEVTIVVPNNANLADVENTFIHEVVGHDGLRVLFPEKEKLDNALDELYGASNDSIKADIDRRAQKMHDAEVERLLGQKRSEAEARAEADRKRDQFKRDATEEYGADLAGRIGDEGFEKMSADEKTFWGKVKAVLQKALDALLHGLKIPGKRKWGDKDWAYVLHEAYKCKRNGGRPSVFDVADTAAMRDKTGFGESMDNGVMFRDGSPVKARDRYDKKINSRRYQAREALQDSMLGLKTMMESVLRGEGKRRVSIEDIPDFENPYLGENRYSSVVKNRFDRAAVELFSPLIKEVRELTRKGDGKRDERKRELNDYLLAKHGVERDELMRRREAHEQYEKYKKATPNGAKTEADFYNSLLWKDYAGLTGLTKDVSSVEAIQKQIDALEEQMRKETDPAIKSQLKADVDVLRRDIMAERRAVAEQMALDYESSHDTTALWDKINKLNHATLETMYENGLMSKDEYNDISNMYQYYVPLRGFNEDTSHDVYDYINTQEYKGAGNPLKKAKGRSSKSDDPIAYMQSMYETATMQSYRNSLIQQKMLNFVLNHPSDLASVSKLWLAYDSVNDEWKPVFPDNIKDTDDPSTVAAKMEDFNNKMEALAQSQPDLYKSGKQAEGIPYRVVGKNDKAQHQIVAKVNGVSHVITINGNPRAALAANGRTNPNSDLNGSIGKLLEKGEAINRQLSAFYTTRNIDFTGSNFVRDMLYAGAMTMAKENPTYILKYIKNYAMVTPGTLGVMLNKYEKGTLGNSEIGRYIREFMENGGETGYVSLKNIERHKSAIKKELKVGNHPIYKGWYWLGEKIDIFNRMAENSARFATYMTSREEGRSVGRSVWDAKQITVNFNKKGAGATFLNAENETYVGKTASLMSGLGRDLYVFWNAGVQGLDNVIQTGRKNPVRMLVLGGLVFALGYMMSQIGANEDEDETNYYDMSKFVRRSNICFSAGDKYVSIPLSVEFRAAYGMGELLGSIRAGKEQGDTWDWSMEAAAQVSQILPIDFMESGNPYIPSMVKPFWEVHENKDWTGKPIYKDNDFNKNMPEYTKVYSNANAQLVDFTKWLNSSTGGDDYTKGKADFNPAKMEYVIKGYLGGYATMADHLVKTTEALAGKRDFDFRNVPVVSRFVRSADERSRFSSINSQYYELKNETDITQQRLKGYTDAVERGDATYVQKLEDLYQSPEYLKLVIFKEFQKDLKAIQDQIKETEDPEVKLALQKQQSILQSKLLEATKEAVKK